VKNNVDGQNTEKTRRIGCRDLALKHCIEPNGAEKRNEWIGR